MSYGQYDNDEFEQVVASFYEINDDELFLSKMYSEMRNEDIKFIDKNVYYYWNEDTCLWTRADDPSFIKRDIGNVYYDIT